MSTIDPGQLRVVKNKSGGVDVTLKSANGHSKQVSSYNDLSDTSVVSKLMSKYGSLLSGDQKDLIKTLSSGGSVSSNPIISQATKPTADAYYPTETSHLDQATGIVTDPGKTATTPTSASTIGKPIIGYNSAGEPIYGGPGTLSNQNSTQPAGTSMIPDQTTNSKPIIGHNAAGEPIYGGEGTLSGSAGQSASTGNTTGNTNATSGSSTNGTGSTTSATSSAVTYDPTLTKYGITQDVWNQMSPTQQAVVSAATGAAQSLANSNASDVTLSKALDAAKNDPNIIAKYADALKLDTQSFSQQLDQLQQATSTDAQKYQTQFENDRRQLAENSAAAGQAYSGLRNRAQEQLGESESGIVSSSRNALKKSVQDLTTAFESKYGSDATTAAKAQFQDPFSSSNVSLSGLSTNGSTDATTLSGNKAGGITGTQPIAKQNDINTLAGQYVTLGQLPQPV